MQGGKRWAARGGPPSTGGITMTRITTYTVEKAVGGGLWTHVGCYACETLAWTMARELQRSNWTVRIRRIVSY